MTSMTLEKVTRKNSLEDFEFIDADGDLNVDLSKSPLHEAAEKITSGVSTVISALSLIAEDQGVTVKIPVQAVAATAVGVITGSLLGGPPGVAIGLLTGAVIAYKNSPSKATVSVPSERKSTIKEIFNKMTFQQKKELIKELLRCLKQPNIRSLVFEILKNEAIRKMAMEIMLDYLKTKMGVGIVKA